MRLAFPTEPLRLLAGPGGVRALGWKLFRALTRVDRYEWLSRRLDLPARGAPAARPTAAGELVSVLSPQDWQLLDAELRAQLDDGSGWGVEPLLQGGARIYAYVTGREVQCQVTIDTRMARLTAPCELAVLLESGECFLSFLVTAPRWQRQGLAAALVQDVMQRLGADGLRHCHCHVQATNVKSLRTFARAGWCSSGTLWARTGRRLIHSRLPAGVTVSST